MARARNKATEANEDIKSDEAAELAALEAALNGDGDMEINDEDFADVDDDALNEALQASEAKEKAYSDQKSSIDISDAPEAEENPEKKANASKNSTPNATRDADAFAKQVAGILGEGAVLDSDEGELTEDQLIEAMKGITQIKVREKVLNLCNHMMSGRELNRYTQIAVKILIDAHNDGCKPVTIGDIKKGYEEAGYKPGTVNAQAGQLMALFRSMRMGKSDGRGVLIPNPNSVILDALASS